MTGLLIRLFLRKGDSRDTRVRESCGRLGGVVGIVCNLFLCVLKLTAGILTGSIAVAADGFNNLSDMGSSVITLIGFRLAGKPADSDHPFGHGRMEYMAAFLVSMLILLVGFELLTGSVRRLVSDEPAPVYPFWTFIILTVSVAVKLWMFFFQRKLGRMIDSRILETAARDSLNDALTTAAVALAAILSLVLRPSFNLDACLAIAVALFILWSGVGSARQTMDQLLGTSPEQSLIEEIKQIILSFCGFVGLHDLLVHSYGPGRQFASAHVEVPFDTELVVCHEQIDLCERLVAERTGVQLVIHVDPVDLNDQRAADVKCAMTEGIRGIDPRMTLHDFRITSGGNGRTNLLFDVIVPSELLPKTKELQRQISELARRLDPAYRCIITFDNDFTGMI